MRGRPLPDAKDFARHDRHRCCPSVRLCVRMVKRAGRPVRGARATPARSAGATAGAESVATITIERIAAGGDGVGRVDGRACFVPRTAPGDVVQVAYLTFARHARGRVLQLVTASPTRVEAACPHYVKDRCGGCQLQHLDAATQADVRTSIVQDALQRIGKREVARPALVSGAPWAYRGRLTLTLKARGAAWIGGLHPFDDASRVFALETCPIAKPSLVHAWHAVRARARGLPKATELRVALRAVNDDASQIAIVIVGGSEWVEARTWASALSRGNSSIVAVWWQRADGTRVSLAAADDGHSNTHTDASLTLDDLSASRDAQQNGGIDDLAPSMDEALAFAQVNGEVALLMRAYVAEQLRVLQPRHVIDAYAGSGMLSEMLARDGVRVTAIEADAVATARAVERLGDLPNLRVLTETVESALAGALPADAIVLNPPRRGLDIRIPALLSTAAVRGLRAIVYVSCDPATLARDLSRLPTWRIASLQCFDMFPQTAHVETVCVLVPETP